MKMLNSRATNQTSETLEHILEGAQIVLTNNGYSAFTMRLVTKKSGVSLET